MITLSYGVQKPELKDFGITVFPALEFNFQRLNDHNHDGLNSALLASQPSPTGHAGKYLSTDGTLVFWALAPQEVATQTGNAGKFLTTDGTNTSWQTITAPQEVATQTGNAGKFLTTDGTNTFWTVVPAGGANTSLSNLVPVLYNEAGGLSGTQINTNLVFKQPANRLVPNTFAVKTNDDYFPIDGGYTGTHLKLTSGSLIDTVGTSGDVILGIGSATAGRGKIKIQDTSNGDGTTGIVGHVWTQIAANGAGAWQAPSGGGGGGGGGAYMALAWQAFDVVMAGGSVQNLQYSHKTDPDNIIDNSGGALKFTPPIGSSGLVRIRTKLSPQGTWNATIFFALPIIYRTSDNVYMGQGDRLKGTWVSGENNNGFHFPSGDTVLQLVPGVQYTVKAYHDFTSPNLTLTGGTNGSGDVNFTSIEVW